MIDFNILIERSYNAIKARGLIKDNTSVDEFYSKILEETREVFDEMINAKMIDETDKYVEELIDLATVCIMQIHHLGYNVINEFTKVVIKNELRAMKSSE